MKPGQILTINIACDDAGFMREQCPCCGLDFKRKVSSEDEQDTLAWWVQHVVDPEQQEAADDSNRAERCPYCGHTAEQQKFVHPDTVAYIRHIVTREIIEPMFAEMFSGLSSGVVKITSSSTRSQRPISGPEPNDQVRVVCLHCTDSFKIDELWRGNVYCPGCHEELAAQ